MSLQKNQNIRKTRKKLDLIDNKLLNLIKIRARHVKNVLLLKEYKNEIIDKKRIKIILKNVKIKSIKKGIDPKISHRIWKSMIYAFIEYEYRNFKKK